MNTTIGHLIVVLALCAGFAPGCGTTRENLATQQLLMSDSVDRAVAQIDFSPLKGEEVYLDTTYLRQIKGTAFVNADYIVSSLRQQMVLAGCLLQDHRDEADFIAEPRVGVLGSDAHDMNYGIPGSQGISAAVSLVGSTPLPSLPEISFARKTADSAATKIAVFAYHRETREPVWQSGLSVARSSAHARWVLGAGPFQSGSIYEGTQFAGRRLGTGSLNGRRPTDDLTKEDTAYRNAAVWSEGLQKKLHSSEPPELLAQEPSDESDRTPDDEATTLGNPDSDRVHQAGYSEDTPDSQAKKPADQPPGPSEG